MKKLVLLFIGLTFISCDGVDDDLDTDFFECTVDFVQFVDNENAIVRFETTLGEETNYSSEDMLMILTTTITQLVKI